MNERIRELVKQAGGDFWQRLENDVLKKDAYITFDPPENLEKFVELIVRECTTIMHEDTSPNCPYVDYFKVTNKIKQHFGVEE